MSAEELQGGRILIVHQGGLGDFILALPAIKALRDSLQPAWVEIMGHPWTLQLVEGRLYADATIDVNRAEMALFFQEGAHLPEGMKAYFSRFDAAIVFTTNATFTHNLQQAGITRVFTLPPFPEGRRHLVDHHLASLAAMGVSVSPSPPRIFLRGEDHQWADVFSRQRGWDLNGVIALHPGAGSRTKAWPPYRFAALGRILVADGGALLIIQGPADEDAVQEVRNGLNGVPYLVASGLPVLNLASLLSRAFLFIGNDSGISHLAAALGIPTIAIFGPTDPLIWAPRGDNALWVQGTTSCAPCSLQQRQVCERQRCLEDIAVEDILTLLSRLMTIHLGEAPRYNSRPPAEGIPCSSRDHEGYPLSPNQ